MSPSPYLLVSPIRLNCSITLGQLIALVSGTLQSFYPSDYDSAIIERAVEWRGVVKVPQSFYGDI